MSPYDAAGFACEFASRVVACFHDGAPAAGSEQLAAHLEGCPSCQNMLFAARRVDALVAMTTPKLDPRTEERLLGSLAVGARARREPALVRKPVVLGIALVLAALVLLQVVWQQSVTNQSVTMPCVAVISGTPATEREGTSLPAISVPDLPAGVTSRLVPQRQPPTPDESALARYLRLPDERNFRAIVQEFGALDLEQVQEVPARQRLSEVAKSESIVQRLQRVLTKDAGQRDLEPEVLRIAARIPSNLLAKCLRAAVRGDRSRADIVAIAAKQNPEPGVAIELCMTLWSDLQARGETQDIESLARHWFGSVPSDWTDSMIEALRRAPTAAQRERCLWALAAQEAPRAVACLTQAAKRPRYEEALLAAYALARCLPPGARPDELRPTWSVVIRLRPPSFEEFARLVDAARRGEIETE